MERFRSYLRWRNINIVLAALVLIALGVVFGPLAARGPQVLQVTPANGAADANPQAGVQIVFSQWVQPDSVRQAIAFDPPVEFAVSEPGWLRAGASTVLIQPQGGLRYGASYRLTIAGGIKNLFGRPLEQPLQLAFATAPYVTVAKLGPEKDAKDVPLRAPILVEFGAPVVPAATIAAAAQDPRISDTLPQPLALAPAAKGVGRWLSPTLFGFYPENLHAATTYTASLRPDVTLDGKLRLERPVDWSFSTAAPLLAGTRPFDGASEVPVSGEVEVRLEPDVDVGSASQGFALREVASGATVQGAIQPSAGGFLFKPAAPLQRGARYQASLAPGIASSTGARLNSSAIQWSFSVIGDLQVAQVEPPADTTEVLTATQRISVRFNHPVVAFTTVDDQAKLPQPLAIEPALAGAGRWLDTSTYVFTPKGGLAPATGYRVRVAAGLQDQTGGALKREYSWAFTTIMPKVFGSEPPEGAQYAGSRDPIQIIFNQPIELAAARGAITLSRGGVAIPGTLAFGGIKPNALTLYSSENGQATTSFDGYVLTFTPAAPLERGASYTIAVAAGLRSAQGNGALSEGYRATFQVAPLPRLEQTTPADGDGDATQNTQLALRFSAPMDWASVEQNLAIEPKPTEYYTGTGETEYTVYFSYQPDTDYRVTLGGAARDRDGVPLGQDSAFGFHTAPLPPALALAGGYRLGAYNAYVATRVPVQHVGTPTISYKLFPLDPAAGLTLANDYESWNNYAPAVAAVKQGDVNLQGDHNQQRIDLLDLGRLDAGLYYLELRGAGGAFDRQLIAVSSYALTLKRSAGQIFVWAIDLATGKPVVDLPLGGAAYNYNTRQAEPAELGATDAEGIFERELATKEPSAPFMIWSLDRQRFALGSTSWSEGVNPWDFGLPADYGNNPLVGSVYTDRPIYRPEQNVYIRGALRIDRHKLGYDLPPSDEQAFVQINDPEGNTVYSATLALSEFGTFNTSIVLERSAKLGVYSISGQLRANGQPSDAGGFYGSFSVAEYRKPAFEITVNPAKPDLIQGDTLEMTVAAKYFSGGALANAPVRWRLLANPFHFSSESAPNYTFEAIEDAYAWYRGDATSSPGGELVADGVAKTDGQGKLVLKLPASLGKDNASRTLTLDVELTDLDGQVLAAQGTANVHAGAFYIGLRPEGYVVRAGQPQAISILTLDPQGAPTGNRKLALSLYKREWNSVRQQGADGQLYWTSHYSDTLVETKDATSDAQGRGSITFAPKDGGEYRIGAEARDAAGHTITSSAYTWVYGGNVFWGVNDTNRVDLIADKSSYKPGDTASILVAAPYPGMRALMTIERGQVIEHKLLTLQGTTELLQVPLKAEYAPNIYVSVVLIKPAGGDVPVPDLRVGLVNLPISTEQQELNIAVTPDKTAAGPRDQLTYTIKATDYSGKGVRAEVGLALVDKAVLSLADDPNPSLTEAFYTKRPLAVFTAPSLTALVDRVTLKLQAGDKGGGGGLAAEVLVRRNFPDTAYWNPAVTTGDDGTAKVTLTLPDSLTTWRMTARGLTADTRVGQTTADLIASKPLLIRPALPRFLTVGDKLVLQAVVQNNTAAAIDATVTLDTGSASETNAPLKLSGDAKQSVAVPANGTALLRWPVEIPAAGQARLRFSVDGGGQADAVEQALPIQRYTTPEVVATAGQVLDTTVETIAAPATTAQSPAGASQGQLELELVPSLAAGVESALGYLETYPYLCSEQTVSRFLPNAVTYRLFVQLGMNDQKLKASLDANLSAGLQRLYALQHLDGGWGWWQDDLSQPYLTAYVAQGLVEAKKAGYAVDSDRFDQTIGYLQSFLGEPAPKDNSQFSALNARSYVLFVLAEAGQPDRGRSVALYAQREQLDLYGRAYLLMTLKTLGGNDEQVRALVGELMSSAILHTADAHWEERWVDSWNMSSDTRTTALALQALIRADPNNFLIPNAVRYLMGQRDGGHWRTTQESAVTLMALAEYIAQSGELEADYSYHAALDGKTLKDGTVNRDNLRDPIGVVVALADIKLGGQSQLTLQRAAASGQTGKGRLYYTLRMRSYQDAGAVVALDRGVGVQREYMAVASDTLSPTGQLVTAAKLSDVVQVRLTLTVPEDLQYFAVEDMLPAGLEPLDASLKTTSAVARGAGLEELDGENPYWWYFNQTSIHDNRVALFATSLPKGTYHYTYLARATTAGAFQTLPATAYQMYAPEVFGRSAGATFTVTEP